MRIAAGVLLILAGIFNLVGGLAYFTVGGVATAADVTVEQMAKEAAAKGTKNDAAAAEAVAMMSDKATEGSVMRMVVGVFLVVMLGLQIAGAVVLFMRKAAKFALVVGALGILAELIAFTSLAISAFGITNIVGLVGSVLAIIAARGYASASSGSGSAAAAA